MAHQNQDQYKAENVEGTVNELFSGKLSLEQALQKLRTRLLDLSARNRLLNYRHPKGRSIQFVDKPNLNLVFNRLVDGKSIQIIYVSDPPPDSYELRRPDVKTYAQSQGIDTDVEFSPLACGETANKHTPKLQALNYPAELDKLCRKLASEARTVIEETGTNMLYLVFGFLEFYENPASNKPLLAPLLSVPIRLERAGTDNKTRTYQYNIHYSDEDIHENQTLREKLSRDFLLQLPTFDEDDEPGTYFDKLAEAFKNQKRWRVRHQLTLGFLSFGKLALWEGLDPEKWPGLLEHPLLNQIFSGGSGDGGALFPVDYDIDSHPMGETPLIYDADSSQHSAIIDVLNGKNMVINGPPGTGKSQTITNIIAAGLKAGKKVLFVSDKLAALEVVRYRLNKASLGHFCLELHSHKTQKKKLLEDIEARIQERFHAPHQLESKIDSLKLRKKELNRYATIMGSKVGNELELTVYDIFWKTERLRQQIGDLAQSVQSIELPNVESWNYADIESRRSKLDAFGQMYLAIGTYDTSHPWWGFFPRPLIPGDEEAIDTIVSNAIEIAKDLFDSVVNCFEFLGVIEEPEIATVLSLEKAIRLLPDPPENLDSLLLPKMLAAEVRVDYPIRTLEAAFGKLRQAQILDDKACSLLLPDNNVTLTQVAPMARRCSSELKPAFFTSPLESIKECISAAEIALSELEKTATSTPCQYFQARVSMLENLNRRLEEAAPLKLLGQPLNALKVGAEVLASEVLRLRVSYGRVRDIAKIRGIEFDGSPSAVSLLGQPDGVTGVVKGTTVDAEIIANARKTAEYLLFDMPIGKIARASQSNDLLLPEQSLQELSLRHAKLVIVLQKSTQLLDEVNEIAQQGGIVFDGSVKGLENLEVLSNIFNRAPTDLLDYRSSSFGHPRALELIEASENAFIHEEKMRSELDSKFYLDSLPTAEELKNALRVFRRGDNFFNFLNGDWHRAKKLFSGMAKNKQKLKAAGYAEQISDLISWMEHLAAFINNEEYKTSFGSLFRGIDTDFSKIRRLQEWYSTSNSELLHHTTLSETIDLSTFDERKISKLASSVEKLHAYSTALTQILGESKELVGPVGQYLESTVNNTGWGEFNQKLQQIKNGIGKAILYLERFVTADISPRRAVDVLNAKLELHSAQDDFTALNQGVAYIQEHTEHILPGISQVSCNSWGSFLDQLDVFVLATTALAEIVSACGGDEIKPAETKDLLEAKFKLDNALEQFSAIPDQAVFDSWVSYISNIREKVVLTEQFTSTLLSAGKPGSTAKNVIEGLEARDSADRFISSVENDEDAISILQGHFDGLKTDLDTLQATTEWCSKIMEDRQLVGMPIRSLLLSEEAPFKLKSAKGLLANVAFQREALESALEKLRDFGAYKWEVWNLSELNTKYAGKLLARLKNASANLNEVLPWSKYMQERKDCESSGLKEFINGAEAKKFPAAAVAEIFEYVAYRSIGKSIYRSHPELERFSGLKHQKMRNEFVTLDEEIISLTGKSFAYEIDRVKKVPPGDSGITASQKTEMQLIRHELGKTRRHLPIRQLIRRAGGAIQALKPCFMMGPLSVAQYLAHGAIEFDIIVMDEASQLRPEEALGAITRGTQLVVVGDPKQLPPTNFFDRLVDGGDDDDEDESPAVLSGSESILDICQQLFHPVRSLRWHYRSQHESLIAFSNYHFYESRLVVFPSPYSRNNRLGVRYRYVKDGIYKDRQNLPEAQRVVAAVLEHMMKYPEESLGVVTLNQTQRDLIEDLLEKSLRNIDEADEFISKWEADGWPFFVKNLENVQGDERDVIFISTTFGKAPGTEKPRQNFGPISRQGGWRRLNVLFTRARRKVELFTSMQSDDIVTDEKTPAGTRALKDYLDFASRGVLTTTNFTGRDPDSDFEVSVGNLLRNHGYEVVPQLGVAGFFIDLAVRNPDRPGEFLAAVECDGATYHSSNSARDRDRIRQSILESLGWENRIWRIWSTDWFYNARNEIDRLLSFLEQRRKIAQVEPAPEYDYEGIGAESEGEEVGKENQVDLSSNVSSPIYGDELCVEVGDLVTYCLVDKPDERHTVMIVDTESNPKLHLVNQETALAKALLDLPVGEEEMVGNAGHKVRVIKIQRQIEIAT
ncbi:DUF4011 domain-containing protein [Sulfurirhabdus autotrophica]|uniref:DUF4011 domain-containing protein n=1 Tax=Sulfurirhabdus autotrophica TaxID=1706046 RepID=UPI00140525A6|nr:DUF4011 domain-containing protein [Sulfurirhabdus autotrophica]